MTQKTPASPEALARGYKNARGNLLLVVIFTVVNAFMAFMGSSSYFLFSAYLPYYSVIFGLVLTGRMDVGQEYQLDEKYLVYFVGFAVLVLGLYLLFWFLSKNARGFMTASLVLFCADCLAYLFGFLIFEFDASSVIEAVFHIWVLWTLIAGVRAARDLKCQEQAAMMMASTMTAEPEAPAQPEKPQSPAM